MGHVTIGLLQHACSATPAENLKKALALAGRAARAGAQFSAAIIDPPARRHARAKSR
jgi:predicted amidohydrolase